MSAYEELSRLPLVVDSCRLHGLSQTVSRTFDRHTTVVQLHGRGERGVGEDVTYHAGDQLAFQRLDVAELQNHRGTLGSFSDWVRERQWFPGGPQSEESRDYRRWSLESAALDLALRQAGCTLAERLGLEAEPVRFVVSLGLGNPPSTSRLNRLRHWNPALEVKLDATSAWGPRLIEELASIGSVAVVDFKGAYGKGNPVDQPADALLYRRVATAFPSAWLEDPALTPQTSAVLRDEAHRVTWDAPIHSVADVEALADPPRTLNMKPSRFGGVRELFEAYAYCRERGIRMYGGGQFELGPGRGQIQYLASLFHAAECNDVAPVIYHETEPRPPLPSSPLSPALAAKGFRWVDETPRPRDASEGDPV